ncbi:MAG: VOC family protein [Woeseia sp.]|nr:VOC family protein [Woeseia sp.]
MIPQLTGVDHVHIAVDNWADAEAWYKKVMGFKRIDALMGWAVNGGPLTIENPEGTVHLAMFEKSDQPDMSAVAFGANADEFLEWKEHLEGHGLKLRLTDHKMAYSLYFSDPWCNRYEITTYDRDHVAEKLAAS